MIDSLKRLTTRVVLQGDYESIRSFIYELEQAPQFVVIDPADAYTLSHPHSMTHNAPPGSPPDDASQQGERCLMRHLLG